MSDGAPKTFEEKLERIEVIVKELESGSVDLQRGTELFKEGKTLARECEAMLQGAQEQIDRATREDPPATASG